MQLEVENDSIRVEYKFTDESFDHEFGRERKTGFEIEKIELYIPAIGGWIDFSHTSEKSIINRAKKIVEDNLD